MRYKDEELKQANAQNIIDVAARLGMTLKRKGARVMALCPLHNDRHKVASWSKNLQFSICSP